MKLVEIIGRAWLCVSDRLRATALLSARLSRHALRPATMLRLIPLLLAGCATATVTSAWELVRALPRPDRVLVYDFVITPHEVELDRGLGPKLTRLINGTAQNREEIHLGRAIAKILSENLATELRMRGIKVCRNSSNILPGEIIASIKGRLLRVDEGNGTLRTLVGFGLGGTEIRTHVQFLHEADGNAQLLAEAETTTKSNLKPGITPIIGAGATTSLLAGAVVAGITTITSERFFATVEADAKRTAAELAEWVADYYRQQGWLGP
jgi:hypothetical protein